jgi:hypothetical protein
MKLTTLAVADSIPTTVSKGCALVECSNVRANVITEIARIEPLLTRSERHRASPFI